MFLKKLKFTQGICETMIYSTRKAEEHFHYSVLSQVLNLHRQKDD